MNDLFNIGNFEPINENFVKESVFALQGLAKIQQKFNKNDMDTFINELHDSIVGKYLGFSLINTEKHGFDCKLNNNEDIFLESKVASYSSTSWAATFNDTTLEKADAFRSKNVWLSLSLWRNISEILCICYGQNELIGDILEKGVLKHKSSLTVRSSQTISMSKLIFQLGFKILSPIYNKHELISYLNLHGLQKLDTHHIIEYKDFISIDK